ncbi:hypothetical protein [uncultured Gimesia sp.]|uniref:hypothetical protein n=1 Tax=uncultured Gimesia sp. TaxID=1678688 RepID=UPI00261E5038|nr:hypothetical protein [uncultured Gimesia sp.]
MRKLSSGFPLPFPGRQSRGRGREPDSQSKIFAAVGQTPTHSPNPTNGKPISLMNNPRLLLILNR